MGNVIKLPVAIPMPEGLMVACKAFGMPTDQGPPVGFQFRRKRGCVDVWLYFKGGLRLNLSVQNKTELRNFYDARGWAYDYACIHGFKAMEIARPRKPKPRPQLRLVYRRKPERV